MSRPYAEEMWIIKIQFLGIKNLCKYSQPFWLDSNFAFRMDICKGLHHVDGARDSAHWKMNKKKTKNKTKHDSNQDMLE